MLSTSSNPSIKNKDVDTHPDKLSADSACKAANKASLKSVPLSTSESWEENLELLAGNCDKMKLSFF